MFEKNIKKAAMLIKQQSNQRIHVYSHYDADGLSSAGIMAQILSKTSSNYSISIIKEITPEIVNEINEEAPDMAVFLDIGSAPEVLNIDSKIFTMIIDHHEPFTKLSNMEHIFYLNPMLFGIEEISNSTVMFFLAQEFSIDASHLGFAGLVGDLCDNNSEYASKMIGDGLNKGLITKSRSLRIFGPNSRSLVKALEYSYDPYIPGISGNESAVIKFIQDLGINAKKEDGSWVSFNDLAEEDKKKLCSSLIMQRISYGHKDAEDIFSDCYTISGVNLDVHEFSTALNAFGRLERYEEGIMFCLKPEQKKYEEIMEVYRKTVGKYLNWVETHKNTPHVIEIGKKIIINGHDEIDSNFIGTVSTILYKSGHDTVIGLAKRDDRIKVSGRSSSINLQQTFTELASMVGGSGGGHKNAAGLSIPLGSEERFINLVKQSLLQH